MILTEKQLATQEAIIKRLYPWVSIDEANEKELELCRGLVYNITILYSTMQHMPPTLSRVLTALWDYCYINLSIYSAYLWATPEHFCKRKLLNEDMTDCNLRQQSQETQDAIYNILCKE